MCVDEVAGLCCYSAPRFPEEKLRHVGTKAEAAEREMVSCEWKERCDGSRSNKSDRQC